MPVFTLISNICFRLVTAIYEDCSRCETLDAMCAIIDIIGDGLRSTSRFSHLSSVLS
jgi:hypothetical protein